MEERIIIIAERDAGSRRLLANRFSNAGYQVKTVASVASLVSSTLDNRRPVLLLGNGFDPMVSAHKLIHLLKTCNSRLQVIMVCDEMPLSLARQVRSEGLFYHALRPTTVEDTEELVTAVACAFETGQGTEPAAASGVLCQGAQASPAGSYLPGLCWLSGLIALVFGVGYLASAILMHTNAMSMWLFLGFCALIVANQLLPIFRIKLPATLRAKHLAKQHGASPHGK